MADKTRPTTILLKQVGHGVKEEGRAASAITPGMLVNLNSSGAVVPHAGAALNAGVRVALEDALQGRTIIDNYAVGELVFYQQLRSGDVFFGILKDGEVASVGSLLTSNGDGKLQVQAGVEPSYVQALEAQSPSGADARIRCVVL